MSIVDNLKSLNYDGDKARRDLIAGLTVAAVSLPQGITYALVAGVDPKFGVYSAIVVTFVASVFGSSSHLINGPTSAISLLVFSSLAFLDPENRTVLFEALFLLGVLVGAFQILIAVFRLVSKSTNVSAGHSAPCNSSRVTRTPAVSSSLRSTTNGCSCSRSFTPLRRSSADRVSSSKVPNRYRTDIPDTPCGFADMDDSDVGIDVRSAVNV